MAESAGSFGQRLRDLRVRREVSQAELAGEELSPSYISRLEAGQRVPTDAVVRLLARRLGCRVEDLLFGEDATTPKDVELELRHAELALRSGAVEDALARFERLAALPEHPHLEPLRDAIELGLAQTLEATGDHDAALARYLRVSKGDPSSALVHVATIGVCRCHLACGDVVLAVEVGEPMHRWLEEIGGLATDAGAELTTVLSAAYRARGDLATAQRLAREALEQAERQGDPRAQARTYRNASLAAYERGATGEALRLAERGLAVLAGEGSADLARLEILRGSLLLRNTPPDADEAIRVLSAARARLLPAQDGTCLTELARAHLIAGEPRRAVEVARAAQAAFEGSPRPEAVRPLLVEAAAGVAGGAEPERALETARQLLVEGGQTRDWARAWREYGDVLAEQGRVDDALVAYDQALRRAGLWPVGEQGDQKG